MPKFGSFFYTPKKKTASVQEKRWNIWSFTKKVLRKACMTLGAIMLFWLVLSGIALFSLSKKATPPLPDDMILVLHIENGVSEINTQPSLLDPFPFRQPTAQGIIETLNRAAQDDRVRGLLVSYQGGGISIAHTQEIRAAIQTFKQSGKFAKIYAPSYMNGKGGMTRYYFASAFDEIWMQPVGMLSITGPSAEMPFFKNPLDKIGVTAQFKQREEFKSAMESFTNDGISPSNKKMLSSLIDSLSSTMTNDIAKDRNITATSLGIIIDQGLFTGSEALECKLVDRVDYADVMISELRKELNDDENTPKIKLTPFERYSQQKVKSKTGKANVALIHVSGAIVDQKTAGGNTAGNDIAKAITEAYEDKAIKAIILRVNSPGGSPSASETIRRALVKAQEKGKKVIVSMGAVAASGGYWIATDADKIFASPGTLTGSIGVIMGKFEGSQLWKNLGVNWDGYQVGNNSDFWSPNQPFDSSSNARLNVLIDDIYDAFLERVSKGRDIPLDQARNIAKGRAWTGEQALKIKLIDNLGGLNDALDNTATIIGLTNRDDLKVVQLPRKMSQIEQLIDAINGGVHTSPLASTIQPVFDRLNKASLMLQGKTMAYDERLETIR